MFIFLLYLILGALFLSISLIKMSMVAYFLSSELSELLFVGDNIKSTLLLTDTISNLAAGESRAGKTTKQFSVSPAMRSGTCFIGVAVDSGSIVDETDEANNIAYSDEVIVLSLWE